MQAAELVEREELVAADEAILRFQRTMEEAARAGALDSERLDRLRDTMKAVVARFNDEVLPRLDPAAAQEISRRLISLLTADSKKQSALDAADEYLVELEAIRHVFRDLLQEQQPQHLRREARELVGLLEAWLPSVPVQQRAALLGITPRQLQRRRNDDGPATSREQLVARLVAILRHAWTDAGVIAWFHRPRPDLDGVSPADLLNDPDRERDLLVAARAGRVQGGV